MSDYNFRNALLWFWKVMIHQNAFVDVWNMIVSGSDKSYDKTHERVTFLTNVMSHLECIRKRRPNERGE